MSHTPNICRREFVLAPTMYESGRESISAEETLCFGAHHVWIWVRGGYVTFEWNYKPTLIETYRNQADRLCVSGIGSNFHVADFGFGRSLRLSPLRSNFCRARMHIYRANSIRIQFLFFFFRAGSIFDSNKILYTSFFYILSKAQQRILLLYMYNMIYKYNDLKIIRLNSKKINQIMFY